MLDCRKDLGKDKLALQVQQSPPGADSGEELSPAGILHHQVESLQHLHHFIQADYVGMSELHHASNFGVETISRSLIEMRLVQDFHSYSLCEIEIWGTEMTQVFSTYRENYSMFICEQRLLFAELFLCVLTLKLCYLKCNVE